MAKIIYRQMPGPWELSQQIPAPRAKAKMQKPQGGGKVLVQIPGGARWGGGGMVMDEIDTCITVSHKQGLFNCLTVLFSCIYYSNRMISIFLFTHKIPACFENIVR